MSGPTPTLSLADVASAFDGARLTMARHLAGLRKSELAARIGKSATAVAGWENGTKHPAAATIGQLALGLKVEPGFFTTRPNDVARLCELPHFRYLRSTSQRARDQAFAYGQLAVDVAATLERHVEFPDITVPSLPVTADTHVRGTAEEAAHILREEWDIGFGPIRHVVRLVENHGVLVVFSRPETAAIDAYSFSSRLRPVVVLNPTKRDYYRQRFDVAHELGHLVMHADAEPGGRTVEDQAHRFAAELLMPAAEIKELLPTAMNRGAWQRLAKLKEQWGVSMQALLFRAKRLGCLSEVSYRNAMSTVSARGWRRHEPGLIDVLEQPTLLPRALELLGQSGIDEAALVAQCRVPHELWRTITARAPRPLAQPQLDDWMGLIPSDAEVVSLLR